MFENSSCLKSSVNHVFGLALQASENRGVSGVRGGWLAKTGSAASRRLRHSSLLHDSKGLGDLISNSRKFSAILLGVDRCRC